MDYLQRFNEQIADFSDIGTNYSQRMYLIEMMLFSYAEKLRDVDFSTFTVSDLKAAIEDIIEYQTDEYDEPYAFESQNIGNPIYEINSLAGLSKQVLSIKPLRKKKRRFF